MSTPKPEVWTVAVCLYKKNTTLDFQGSIEMFGFLAPDHLAVMGEQLHNPKISLDLHFLAESLEPVVPDSGPRLVPTGTYAAAEKQYDIIFVPGGSGGTAELAPKDLLEFLKKQAPRARYVLTVCTGSWVLAGTGLLDGKRATTNKWSFNRCKAATSDKIQWVPKARWVVDGNFWTSSGVTAGMDMANAWLIHIVGEETTKAIKGVVEFTGRDQDDDEFAAVHGLV